MRFQRQKYSSASSARCEIPQNLYHTKISGNWWQSVENAVSVNDGHHEKTNRTPSGLGTSSLPFGNLFWGTSGRQKPVKMTWKWQPQPFLALTKPAKVSSWQAVPHLFTHNVLQSLPLIVSTIKTNRLLFILVAKWIFHIPLHHYKDNGLNSHISSQQ